MNLEEFLKNKEKFIQETIELGRNCPIEKVELSTNIESIKKLDRIVEIIRGLYQKKMLDDIVAWNISVGMGVLLGEMIINKEKFKWTMNDENIPVVQTPDNAQLSPITKIYKIIKSKENDEGSPSDFYELYIAMMNFSKLPKEKQSKVSMHWDEEKKEFI